MDHRFYKNMPELHRKQRVWCAAHQLHDQVGATEQLDLQPDGLALQILLLPHFAHLQGKVRPLAKKTFLGHQEKQQAVLHGQSIAIVL